MLKTPTMNPKVKQITDKLKTIQISAPLALMIVVLALQLFTMYLAFNPINVYNQYSSVQRLNKAIAGVKTAPVTLPQSVGVVGDKTTLASAETIKKANAIDGEVYKDAQDGDLVLGYTGRTVIIREGDNNKIVYDGDSAPQKLNNANTALLNAIIKTAKDAGVIKEDPAQAPATSILSEATLAPAKKNNPFYANAEVNDIVAQFDNVAVVIYRPSTGKLINSGKIETNIK
jgi:hypothetical protein